MGRFRFRRLRKLRRRHETKPKDKEEWAVQEYTLRTHKRVNHRGKCKKLYKEFWRKNLRTQHREEKRLPRGNTNNKTHCGTMAQGKKWELRKNWNAGNCWTLHEHIAPMEGRRRRKHEWMNKWRKRSSPQDNRDETNPSHWVNSRTQTLN